MYSSSKNILIKSFRGAVLLQTLVFALIIGFALSILILFSLNFNQIQIQYKINSRLELNIDNAIALILNERNDSIYRNLCISAQIECNDSTVLNQKLWGAYTLVSLKSFYGKFSKSKFFLMGAANDSFPAIYLNSSLPLNVTGSNSIIGNCYLSKAGAKRNYIEGRAPSFDEIIEGEIFLNDKEKQLSTRYPSYEEYWSSIEKGAIKSSSFDSFNKIVQPFDKPTIVYCTKEKLEIESAFIKNNICLQSDSMIVLKASSVLSNILIISPKVYIEKNFKGKVHVLATDSIIVEKGAHLAYPSSLMLIKDPVLTSLGVIWIQDSAYVSGAIVAYQKRENEEKTNKTLIQIDKKSTVEGLVFSDDYVIMNGTLLGTALLQGFIYFSGTSYYDNQLVDAVIDKTRLSKYLNYPCFINSKFIGKKSITQWLVQ